MSYVYEKVLYGNLAIRGKTVIDVGAGFGVGANSLGFWLLSGARHIYAFEEDPQRFKLLREIYGNNPKVTLLNAWTGQLIPGDVLKVDCEGCEVQLTPAILNAYAQWSIGVHSWKISQAEYVQLKRLLLTNGGRLLRLTDKTGEQVFTNA